MYFKQYYTQMTASIVDALVKAFSEVVHYSPSLIGRDCFNFLRFHVLQSF